MKIKQPKFIYLDVGNVLVYKRTTEGENIARELGFQPDQYETIIQKVIELQGEKISSKFWNIRTLDDETQVLNEFHRKMCEYLKIDSSDDLIHRLTNYRTKGDFVLKEGVVDALESLSSRYKLGVLSNALPSRRHHELTLGGIDKYFDQIIISMEVGFHKPDKQIYEIAINMSGVHPSEILFVDDKISYLEGATKAGIHNLILFGSKDSTNKFLKIKSLRELVTLLL